MNPRTGLQHVQPQPQTQTTAAPISTSTIFSLPLEVILNICDLLSQRALLSFSMACRTIHNCIRSSCFHKVSLDEEEQLLSFIYHVPTSQTRNVRIFEWTPFENRGGDDEPADQLAFNALMKVASAVHKVRVPISIALDVFAAIDVGVCERRQMLQLRASHGPTITHNHTPNQTPFTGNHPFSTPCPQPHYHLDFANLTDLHIDDFDEFWKPDPALAFKPRMIHPHYLTHPHEMQPHNRSAGETVVLPKYNLSHVKRLVLGLRHANTMQRMADILGEVCVVSERLEVVVQIRYGNLFGPARYEKEAMDDEDAGEDDEDDDDDDDDEHGFADDEQDVMDEDDNETGEGGETGETDGDGWKPLDDDELNDFGEVDGMDDDYDDDDDDSDSEDGLFYIPREDIERYDMQWMVDDQGQLIVPGFRFIEVKHGKAVEEDTREDSPCSSTSMEDSPGDWEPVGPRPREPQQSQAQPSSSSPQEQLSQQSAPVVQAQQVQVQQPVNAQQLHDFQQLPHNVQMQHQLQFQQVQQQHQHQSAAAGFIAAQQLVIQQQLIQQQQLSHQQQQFHQIHLLQNQQQFLQHQQLELQQLLLEQQQGVLQDVHALQLKQLMQQYQLQRINPNAPLPSQHLIKEPFTTNVSPVPNASSLHENFFKYIHKIFNSRLARVMTQFTSFKERVPGLTSVTMSDIDTRLPYTIRDPSVVVFAGYLQSVLNVKFNVEQLEFDFDTYHRYHHANVEFSFTDLINWSAMTVSAHPDLVSIPSFNLRMGPQQVAKMWLNAYKPGEKKFHFKLSNIIRPMEKMHEQHHVLILPPGSEDPAETLPLESQSSSGHGFIKILDECSAAVKLLFPRITHLYVEPQSFQDLLMISQVLGPVLADVDAFRLRLMVNPVPKLGENVRSLHWTYCPAEPERQGDILAIVISALPYLDSLHVNLDSNITQHVFHRNPCQPTPQDTGPPTQIPPYPEEMMIDAFFKELWSKVTPFTNRRLRNFSLGSTPRRINMIHNQIENCHQHQPSTLKTHDGDAVGGVPTPQRPFPVVVKSKWVPGLASIRKLRFELCSNPSPLVRQQFHRDVLAMVRTMPLAVTGANANQRQAAFLKSLHVVCGSTSLEQQLKTLFAERGVNVQIKCCGK